jgi:hypothetical protein
MDDPRRTLWERPPRGARWRRSLLLALPAAAAFGACDRAEPIGTGTTDEPSVASTGTSGTATGDTGTRDTGTDDTGYTFTGTSTVPTETGDTGYAYPGTTPGTTPSTGTRLGPTPKPTRAR